MDDAGDDLTSITSASHSLSTGLTFFPECQMVLTVNHLHVLSMLIIEITRYPKRKSEYPFWTHEVTNKQSTLTASARYQLPYHTNRAGKRVMGIHLISICIKDKLTAITHPFKIQDQIALDSPDLKY